MVKTNISRRDSLLLIGGGAALAAGGLNTNCGKGSVPAPKPIQGEEESPEVLADRKRRMKWWHEAKFGMFIHWGLYSLIGHHEWAMEKEGIPVLQYQELAKLFKPQPNAARAWAKLAKQAGQKYMVMTTKHHEGFCNWDTKLTNYCAPKQGPGRDLVAEYVQAARAEGLHVGFYYSLMDWHHPDGARCSTDEAARKRFVEYTHGLVRELMTDYGKIDVLWYDMDLPLTAEQWESEKMNEMVFRLQPDIIVNNRNGLPGDFSTPEQEIQAEKEGRAWESCMTMNDSWGYMEADDAWKNAKTIVRNLVMCANGGGNYLLNIGPKPDGSVPEQSVRVLSEVGKWMDKNGPTIYESEPCKASWQTYAGYTRKENTLHIHVHYWPAQTVETQALEYYKPPVVVGVGGLRAKVKSARLFATGKKVDFVQDDISVRFTGLPQSSPDSPFTVIEAECDSEPIIESDYVRRERPRAEVGI
jgi:alpha-L-fucosidase